LPPAGSKSEHANEIKIYELNYMIKEKIAEKIAADDSL